MNQSFAEALKAGLIEPAILWDDSPFVVDGVQYYRAVNDGKNMTLGRFHDLSDLLQRHDALKVSEGVISSYLDMMEMLSNRIAAQASLDAEQVLDASAEIKVLTARIRTRIGMRLSVEQVYEIASIWFFSDQESPSSADMELNRKKIQSWANWDKAGLLYAYFLNQPIGSYIPQVELSSEPVLAYIQNANEIELLDLTRLMVKMAVKDNPKLEALLNYRRETAFALDNPVSQLLEKQ